MSDPTSQPGRTDEEIVADYRNSHFSKKRKYRLKDLRRGALIALANATPGLWGAQVHNPIFVVGCARSGTTILETLLAEHRDVANWSEASTLWDPTGYYWSISERETPPLWVDPEGYTTRWRRDNKPRGKEIRATFGLFQGINRKGFLLNKNPENLFRIADILEIFPEAHVVHIVRDGRAMVYSALNRMLRKLDKWPDFHRIAGVDYSKEDMAVLMSTFWLKSMIEVENQDKSLRLKANKKLIEVRYEDLCSDGSATLRQICELVGLDMARFKPSAWEIPLNSQNFKWKKGLDPELVRKMEDAMQPKLAEWGYER